MENEDDYSRKRLQIGKQLAELADLEKTEKIIGIRFAVEQGAIVTTEDSLAYVIDTIKLTSKLLLSKHIVKPGYCPPVE